MNKRQQCDNSFYFRNQRYLWWLCFWHWVFPKNLTGFIVDCIVRRGYAIFYFPFHKFSSPHCRPSSDVRALGLSSLTSQFWRTSSRLRLHNPRFLCGFRALPAWTRSCVPRWGRGTSWGSWRLLVYRGSAWSTWFRGWIFWIGGIRFGFAGRYASLYWVLQGFPTKCCSWVPTIFRVARSWCSAPSFLHTLKGSSLWSRDRSIGNSDFPPLPWGWDSSSFFRRLVRIPNEAASSRHPVA